MPETVLMDQENQIIFVKSWGHITEEDTTVSKCRVFELYEETGIDKVLVDASEQLSFLGTINAYELAKKVHENSVSRNIKCAVIPSVHTRDKLCFLETTCQNRGVNMMIHDSREEAIAWLQKEISPGGLLTQV